MQKDSYEDILFLEHPDIVTASENVSTKQSSTIRPFCGIDRI